MNVGVRLQRLGRFVVTMLLVFSVVAAIATDIPVHVAHAGHGHDSHDLTGFETLPLEIGVAAVAKESDSILTKYTLRAPMDGMIVRRHLVQGELVKTERAAFAIADTSSVWINISLYSGDLAQVNAGQPVTLEMQNGSIAEGTISFVSYDVPQQTRTATARVVLKGASLSRHAKSG